MKSRSPPEKGAKELEERVKHLTEGCSEWLHILSHDPSLALFRIQEHVRKTLPGLIGLRIEMGRLNGGLGGAAFDLANAAGVCREMGEATSSFQRYRPRVATIGNWRLPCAWQDPR